MGDRALVGQAGAPGSVSVTRTKRRFRSVRFGVTVGRGRVTHRAAVESAFQQSVSCTTCQRRAGKISLPDPHQGRVSTGLCGPGLHLSRLLSFSLWNWGWGVAAYPAPVLGLRSGLPLGSIFIHSVLRAWSTDCLSLWDVGERDVSRGWTGM